MIEPLDKSAGVSRAKAICDDCGREEVVTCDYERHANDRWTPDEGQILRKMVGKKWSFSKRTLRCPTCEAKRKVVPMTKPTPVEQPPREPTRAEKRQIMDMLTECYDSEAERYTAGDTDHTVAETLGVMVGWVSQLREEFFGPDGANDDMADLASRLDKATEALDKIRAELDEAAVRFDSVRAKAEAEAENVGKLRVALRAIEQAVGPRAMAKAGGKR